jgi:hypothetical protein
LLKPQASPLGVPGKRSIPEHIGKPQLLRLPSVEDRFDDVQREAGKRQDPADVGVRDALLLRKVGDRLSQQSRFADPYRAAIPASRRRGQGTLRLAGANGLFDVPGT